LRFRIRDGSVAILIAVGCAAAFGCGPKAKQPPGATGPVTTTEHSLNPALIEPYLKIQSALATGSFDGVTANAGRIATAAVALGAPAAKIDAAALRLAAAADVTDARAKFGELSDALVNYMTGLRLALPAGVRQAYCPMVGKPWLQEGSTLANPYYGPEMPTCGEFR
jgi:hypothetical protein